MSVSNDPGHFFTTTASLETQEKRRLKASNKNGNPLILPSKKIMAFCIDPSDSGKHLQRLFTGESGGLARRVNLEVLHRQSVKLRG
jgi:hypothetical protein